jgi:spore germination protein GerM
MKAWNVRVVVIAVALVVGSCSTSGEHGPAGPGNDSDESAPSVASTRGVGDLENPEPDIASTLGQSTTTSLQPSGECVEPEDVGEDQVVVYFPCTGAGPGLVIGVVRDVPPQADPLRLALHELIAGPRPEERASYASEALPSTAQYDTYKDGDILVVDFVASTVDDAGITIYKDVGAAILFTAGQFGDVVEIRLDGRPLPED